MAKIHPLLQSTQTSYQTSTKQTFTIWMKSLVMQGNGCTVYDQKGDVVYRVDNYDRKGSSDVYLMDLAGKVLVTILQKNLFFFKRWDGYRNDESNSDDEKRWFRVKKDGRVRLFSGDDDDRSIGNGFRLQGTKKGKLEFTIVDVNGNIVAEAKRKQSSSGVVLGDDVLSLVVEAQVDHSFIIALVTVYGLINQRL